MKIIIAYTNEKRNKIKVVICENDEVKNYYKVSKKEGIIYDLKDEKSYILECDECISHTWKEYGKSVYNEIKLYILNNIEDYKKDKNKAFKQLNEKVKCNIKSLNIFCNYAKKLAQKHELEYEFFNEEDEKREHILD